MLGWLRTPDVNGSSDWKLRACAWDLTISFAPSTASSHSLVEIADVSTSDEEEKDVLMSSKV